MAHRLITQLVFTSARVFGRAFTEAYKQANASRSARQAAGHVPHSAHTSAGRGTTPGSNPLTAASHGLSLDEACRILNVAPTTKSKAVGPEGEHKLEAMQDKFRKLFDQNEPKNGGSFYLQSKILRARERIEMEFKEGQAREEAKKTAEDLPKVYKD
ncbi:MAG: mitochondrial import inner membrane translocase subunit TIM16 [Alyxoria varia]|nr:MAG: mitochondrial import inner membrane translocase subunit TIM16 [Alyxoria varia]